MANLVNNHPSQIQLIKYEFEKEMALKIINLPNNWMFWHEPQIGGYTPDFVIIIDEPNIKSLIILEVKNWSKQNLRFFHAEENTVTHGGTRDLEPIYKLEHIKDELEARLTHLAMNHYSFFNNLLPVVTVLGFKQQKNDIHPNFLNDGRVPVLSNGGGNLKELKNFFIEKSIEKHNNNFNLSDKEKIILKNTICLKHGVPLSDNQLNIQDQEARKRLGIRMDDKQRQTIENSSNGHRKLAGFPGSGKTLVMLARMSYYSRRYPESKQLFIVTQLTLKKNLEDKYFSDFKNTNKDNVLFLRFEDWVVKNVDNANKELRGVPPHKKPKLLSKICKELLDEKNTTFNFKNGEKPCYDFIYVDETHQMLPEWINALKICALSVNDRTPNIWIAADNGQCIYKHRSFVQEPIGLNFRGRSVIFHRIYRSGLYPWLFAACCHPRALRVENQLTDINDIEFVKPGKKPKKLWGKNFVDQANKLKQRIIAETTELKKITLFYAVMGFNDESPYHEALKDTLDTVFNDCGDGGVEWLSINQEHADYDSNRIRACSFTSSQGIDSPVAVLFGAETFQIFDDEGTFDTDALFYTVLTRSVDWIIITYNSLEGDGYYQKMLDKGLFVFDRITKLHEQGSINLFNEEQVDDEYQLYKLNWRNIDKIIQNAEEYYLNNA